MNFTSSILSWYKKNKRDLPWRKNSDPYTVWISEIILQQTRIDQGLPYYLNFVKKYPNISSLAKANEQDVLILWQGLGYYSRARNLLKTAKTIVKTLNGKFPETQVELKKLNGIGEYTANAISSICFNEKRAVVDGNVYRVISRFYGIDKPINNSVGKKYFSEIAQDLAPNKSCGDYNQGIMDFGSLICKPKNPLCMECVLANNCIAKKTNSIDYFPVKIKGKAPKIVHFNYIVFLDANYKTYINQIENGIWKNLFQFPLIESNKELDKDKIMANKGLNKLVNLKNCEIKLFNIKPIIHKLSHRIIYTKFWILSIENTDENSIKFIDIKKYPVSKLIQNFLEKFNYKTFLKTFSYK
ncbi:MAG: A/G-specific adenine glycosylase [Flavobacteriaceae bacterium]|jgi:A/G-specific adenine glycosylase|nr:A/G-specific adenine glycosylase [Flavobacteriaceae bacterium]|tara:strand:- start:99 stop:1166 length:1068 start_codon:yes stop_codon:yes gene_type:complete